MFGKYPSQTDTECPHVELLPHSATALMHSGAAAKICTSFCTRSMCVAVFLQSAGFYGEFLYLFNINFNKTHKALAVLITYTARIAVAFCFELETV